MHSENVLRDELAQRITALEEEKKTSTLKHRARIGELEIKKEKDISLMRDKVNSKLCTLPFPFYPQPSILSLFHLDARFVKQIKRSSLGYES